jgi:lytic murein transglycosylase
MKVPSPPPSEPRSVSVAPPATEEALPKKAFADWIANFTATARSAGIGEETLRAAFSEARYLPRVVELDRAQPEFTRTVWDYLDRTVTPQRIAIGQSQLATPRESAGAHSKAAAPLFGVPLEIVVAIWGMESNYGANMGEVSTIDALATLGFEGRREAWARRELLAALKILQNGDIDRAHMLGSWAGAMGQTQFLPSSYLSHAVDADGDGRRDIWGSMADVVESTANLLAQSGWQAGQPWGVEVRLPPGFDAGRADESIRQSAGQWAAEGVQSVDGTSLPDLADAAILLPAGASGPAFMVGGNFRAILRYNNSTSYALAVGLLAQGLAGGIGGIGVQAAWPRHLQALSRSQMLSMQAALNERGLASGKPDGMMGPATRAALRRFQLGLGLAADGYPTLDLLLRLQAP